MQEDDDDISELNKKKGMYVKIYPYKIDKWKTDEKQHNFDQYGENQPLYCKIEDIDIHTPNHPLIVKCSDGISKRHYSLDDFEPDSCSVSKLMEKGKWEGFNTACIVPREKIKYTKDDIDIGSPDFLWSIGTDEENPNKYSIDFDVYFNFNKNQELYEEEILDEEKIWNVEQRELIEEKFKSNQFKKELLKDTILTINAFNDVDDWNEMEVKQDNSHLHKMMSKWIDDPDVKLEDKFEMESAKMFDGDNPISFRYYLKAKNLDHKKKVKKE